MDCHWVIEERRTTGKHHRSWRETSRLLVKTEAQARRYYEKYYLSSGPEPGWRSRLVRVREVREVLETEKYR